ncbi:hypothetical protein AB833_17250 [Chromatiales bacterium (ex Bugula neritina AB1)]|nr:hypothetical protein AB833_17250 [Chromatiales bacterium (ex Bugula neritina AB1)]
MKNDTFLARLKEGRLTSSEAYQQARETILSSTHNVPEPQQGKEEQLDEWKTWRLLPEGETAVSNSNAATTTKGEPLASGGKDVLRAIKALDRHTL